MREEKNILLFIIAAVLMLAAASPARADVGHSAWGQLLKKHVSPKGVVNYAGFKADETKLDAYLSLLESTEPAGLSKNDKLAFYINVYNAWTVKLILTGYPGLKSIKELGSVVRSPWKKKIVRLKSGIKTLDHIEHNIIRPTYKDPRIHFAVNCASIGCPPLLDEPYTGAKVQKQLDRVTKSFINDPKRTWLKGGKLYLNEIFKWYKGDFGDRLAFVTRYAAGDLKSGLASQKGTIDITFYDYDWSLNGR